MVEFSDFPHLTTGEYAVLQSEGSTGINLVVSGLRYWQNNKVEDERFLVFSSLGKARAFAQSRIVQQTNLEVCIYDSEKNYVEMFKNGDSIADDRGFLRKLLTKFNLID